MPTCFPVNLAATGVVVQLSGQASGGTNAAFSVEVDKAVIGTGTAGSNIANYIFTVQPVPHQVHRIAFDLTNGVNTGTFTTALNNLALQVNHSRDSLADPEAQGTYGAYGFAVGNDALPVTNFSATHEIVYRNGGESQDLMDWTDWSDPSYVDPKPGSIDDNILYQNVDKAAESVFGPQPVEANSLLANSMFTPPQKNRRLHSRAEVPGLQPRLRRRGYTVRPPERAGEIHHE